MDRAAGRSSGPARIDRQRIHADASARPHRAFQLCLAAYRHRQSVRRTDDVRVRRDVPSAEHHHDSDWRSRLNLFVQDVRHASLRQSSPRQCDRAAGGFSDARRHALAAGQRTGESGAEPGRQQGAVWIRCNVADTDHLPYERAEQGGDVCLRRRRQNLAGKPDHGLGGGDRHELHERPGSRFRGSAATDTAQVYTEVNGPRADTTITKFWLDRFGAPRRIENALGQYTTLTRGDARWPSLVTRLAAVNGLVTTAGYDDHGNVLADTVWNPLGTGQNAVSTYQWDKKWDFVTLTITPTGQQTQLAYDGVTGNTVYSIFGGDTTTFAYTSSGLLQTVTTSDQAHDSYTYDTLGNLATHTPPLASTTTVARDAIGRDTLTLTPSAANDTMHVRTLYDLVGADTLTRTWGLGDTLVVRTRYDAAGRDTSVTQHAYPDRNTVGDVTRSFSYDAVGRKTAERLHGQLVLSWKWDAAGNLRIGGHDAAGVTTTYDALNRPTVQKTAS